MDQIKSIDGSNSSRASYLLPCPFCLIVCLFVALVARTEAPGLATCRRGGAPVGGPPVEHAVLLDPTCQHLDLW
jgi:hypothetical protein